MDKELLIKRGIAFFIDFYLGALVSTIPISIISVTTIKTMTQNVFLLEKDIAIIAVMLGLFMLCIYYFVVPSYIFPSQTVGKKIIGITIDLNQKKKQKSLFKRQVIGYMLLEGSLTPTGKLVFQLISLLSGYNIVSIGLDVGNYITIASVGLLLCGRRHLMIHDYLGKSNVIINNSEKGKRIVKLKEKKI
ncbi:RDD family protein [Breznakia blatticola]|uniref:RDD family protein n=1 Tax=Breznakia blatticola TaxID=1754012 RepID=A0A4V3G6S8_9FIRM|nr:RDD family protein [Breznakia blatticola]TDW16524.1 RDD family protein [Breznakia blatticola]